MDHRLILLVEYRQQKRFLLNILSHLTLHMISVILFDASLAVDNTGSNPLLLLSHFSRVWLCETPQTVAHQAPPSLGFSRQEHWSGLPFPSPSNPLGICKQSEPPLYETQTTELFETDFYAILLSDNNWQLTRLTMEWAR